MNRRKFIKTSALAASAICFPTVVPSSVFGQNAPSNRINIGNIGVGSRWNQIAGGFLSKKDVRLNATCDVQSDVLKKSTDRINNHYKNKECKSYNDFRELLNRKDIDAVIIANTDHWHVLSAIEAAKQGKDIYLEKPMGLSMGENHALGAAVKRYNRIFQFGTQQRSTACFRQACQLVRSGAIGKLQSIKAWAPGSVAGGSNKVVGVPDTIDYKMWTGPAPMTPYTENRCSNRTWWFISDYALGFIAGWGIHPVDVALWGGGKETQGNIQIEGKGVFPTTGVHDTAIDWDVTCEYESGVEIHFTGQPTGESKTKYGRTLNHGTVFEGSQGWVHVNRSWVNTAPEALATKFFPAKDLLIKYSNDHAKDFIDSIKTRNETVCPIDDAIASDAFCQLSEIAIRLEQKLQWNAPQQRFTNNKPANAILTRAMSNGWHL